MFAVQALFLNGCGGATKSRQFCDRCVGWRAHQPKASMGHLILEGALAFLHIDTFLTPTANAVKIEVTWLRILVLGTRRRGVPLEVDDPLTVSRGWVVHGKRSL